MHSKILVLLLIACFSACKFADTVYKQPSSNILIDDDAGSSKTVEKLIEPYSEGMSKSMNAVIGFCPQFIEKKKPYSAIGSMMADAVMESATEIEPNTTFCLLNYGGIRSSLDSGNITVGEVYQIMPFENEIVILKMKSTYLDTLQQFIKNKNGEPMSKEVNSLNLEKLKTSAYFYLATNDYMANGGDNYGFLKHSDDRIVTGIKIREALLKYIKKNNPLPLDFEKRVL